MFADSDISTVKHHGVVVDEHVFVQYDAVPMVAMKRWADGCCRRKIGNEFIHQRAVFRVTDSQRTQAGTKSLCTHNATFHFRVSEAIQLLAPHLFKFGFHQL